mmetsp:Transcript_17211/g.39781  ORF Transcript_17211/g.39781 Transcript_17211/m.39781 type:complete len:217 (+) Transcript_17211:3652-4302(+)
MKLSNFFFFLSSWSWTHQHFLSYCYPHRLGTTAGPLRKHSKRISSNQLHLEIAFFRQKIRAYPSAKQSVRLFSALCLTFFAALPCESPRNVHFGLLSTNSCLYHQKDYFHLLLNDWVATQIQNFPCQHCCHRATWMLVRSRLTMFLIEQCDHESMRYRIVPTQFETWIHLSILLLQCHRYPTMKLNLQTHRGQCRHSPMLGFLWLISLVLLRPGKT